MKPDDCRFTYLNNFTEQTHPRRSGSLSAQMFVDAEDIIGGVESFQDLTQIEQLQKQLHSKYAFEDFIGRGPEMRRLFDVLPLISKSSSSVLIEGASGTGKELFSRAIHNFSPRKSHRFVPVNCAALPDTLLESELYGHKAGAFTDAKRDKADRFTLTHKGTILLDEISATSHRLCKSACCGCCRKSLSTAGQGYH